MTTNGHPTLATAFHVQLRSTEVNGQFPTLKAALNVTIPVHFGQRHITSHKLKSGPFAAKIAAVFAWRNAGTDDSESGPQHWLQPYMNL